MGKNESRQPIKPLPFTVYYGTTVLLVLSGMATSLYLAVSHYRVYTDIGYKSFCALSRAINCDTVAQSPYAVFAGVPVAVWGIIGYFFLFLLLMAAGRRDALKKRGWALLTLFAGAFSIISVGLAAVSSLIIHSYCIMCVLSYAITFLLLYFSWLTRRRFEKVNWLTALREDLNFFRARRRMLASNLVLAAFVVGLPLGFYPHYWTMDQPVFAGDIPTGVTDGGHPWIGATDPELVIVEFADYQCFQCKKMHYFLRGLVVQHPQKIRLVHRHFPMDADVNPIVNEPYHRGAGKLARLAIQAAALGHFWQFNDALYQSTEQREATNLKQLAASAGLKSQELAAGLNDPRVQMQLKIDILTGIKLGLNGTPGFLIEDQLYHGAIPPDKLKRYID